MRGIYSTALKAWRIQKNKEMPWYLVVIPLEQLSAFFSMDSVRR